MTKKTTKKEEVVTEEPLLILSDLVENSDKDYSIIVGCLVEAGLYEQFEQEMEYKQYNLPVKASITQKEFDKIIKKLGV